MFDIYVVIKENHLDLHWTGVWRLPLYPMRIPSGSDFAILVNDEVVCAGHGNCEVQARRYLLCCG